MVGVLILRRLFFKGALGTVASATQSLSVLAKCFSAAVVPNYLEFPEDSKIDEETKLDIVSNLLIHDNFVNPEEESNLLAEVEPYMKRLHYEFDHWDDAIHGYRETERLHWNDCNSVILQRIRDTAFPGNSDLLEHVHVLDLAQDGYIKPHVDSVKFCGNTIAGLSLLSPCVMRFVNEKDPSQRFDALLKQRSLYIIKGCVRYGYTHEIVMSKESYFKKQPVPRGRRISVICRSRPGTDNISSQPS